MQRSCHLLLIGAIALCILASLVSCSNYVHSTLLKSTAKLEHCIKDYGLRQVDVSRRTLVIFHIGDLGLASNSLDIAINNLKIFLGSMEKHSKSSFYKAFYLFNVVDEFNPLLGLIPTTRSNVAMLRWTKATSDLEIHLRTVQVLGTNVTDQFSTIIFGNQGMRGPLARRENGEWIGEFQKVLNAHNVAMMGPTMSCEVLPHIQTHMFAIRTSIVPVILADMRAKLSATYKTWKELITSLEVGLTGVVTNAGYNVSSFLYQSRGQPYFQQCLKYTGPPNRFDQNPTGWCGVDADQLLFVKWGGEPMRTPGMVCNTSLLYMEDKLVHLSRVEPELQLIIPEVMMGGPMYPLFKEYVKEAWLDKQSRDAQPKLSMTTGAENSQVAGPGAVAEGADKVCFLVRVLRTLHIEPVIEHENPNTHLLNKGLELLVTTLRRQSNPNWRALLYRIDAQPSDEDLAATLRRFADPRLEHVRTAANTTYLPQDGGYAVTDSVLQSVLGRQECKWVSLTSSDNAYGSEVVDRILKYPAENVGILMNPADSRRFMEQDMLFQKRFMIEKEIRLEEYCGMLPALEQTSLTHGMRPVPSLDGMDVAFVFINRDRWQKEKTMFGHFADSARYPCLFHGADPVGYRCLNNQGVQLIFHLVQRRLWSYKRLPIDGLRSVVFHGNSPTLCIGSGNVWVDHYDPAQQRCITPKDALTIDVHPYWRHIYHMPHFFTQGQLVGTCLRVRQTPEAYEAATVHRTEPLNAKLNKAIAWYLRWLQNSAKTVASSFL